MHYFQKENTHRKRPNRPKFLWRQISEIADAVIKVVKFDNMLDFVLNMKEWGSKNFNGTKIITNQERKKARKKKWWEEEGYM